MAEASQEDKSTVVTLIRENVKENIRIARLKNRQDELDSLRITFADVEDHCINLQTFTTNDVLAIANKIKKQRHASVTELQKLSHAFLQSSENITCFVNATGALPVIVKEMTGTKTETQMIAIECLCNLSLGSENCCEKIAQRAATYLHTFLQSSNESLVRTSLWCLTNLIVGGNKPLRILLSQEIVGALVNIAINSHSGSIKDESYLAIEKILDHGGVPRPSDTETLSKWVLNQTSPLCLATTKIVYKLLNLLNFQSADPSDVQKLLHLCFDTLIHLNDTTRTTPADSWDEAYQIVLLMRICSNIVALENSLGEYIIENWFRSPNRSMASFFNHFIEFLTANNLSSEETLWFISNILKCQQSEFIINYLESDAFYTEININM